MYPIKVSQTCTSDNHTSIRGGLKPGFCICFIVDLLMHCEFCYVNIIGRSWRR